MSGVSNNTGAKILDLPPGIANFRFLYYADLIKRPVCAGKIDNRIGRLTDLVFAIKEPYPEAVGIYLEHGWGKPTEFIPWTRVVSNRKTTHGSQTVDLPEFIQKHREELVLKPNNSTGDLHSYNGWETDEAGWDRALRTALRTPYVVQAKADPVSAIFPTLGYGGLEMKEMRVDIHPLAYLGKVQGCSTWVSASAPSGFSTIAGLAPTYVLESR